MSFMSCIMRAMFTYGELVKVLESSGHTGTLYFLLVCLFAVLIIEKKLSNGGNFEVISMKYSTYRSLWQETFRV